MTDFISPNTSESRNAWRQTSTRSKAPLIAFLLLVLLAMSVTLVLLEFSKKKPPITQKTTTPIAPIRNVEDPAIKEITPRKEAEDKLKEMGIAPKQPDATDPLDLITAIGNALANKDMAAAEKLIGSQALTADNIERLKKLSTDSHFKLRAPNPVREVGELEINKRARYSLELADQDIGRDRIYFDLLKEAGLWKVEKLTLPPGAGEPISRASIVDSLGISDAFLLAVLDQNFSLAKEFVNSEKVSDATLAGLCILFEEGNYRLRAEKPLRAMLQKDDLSSFLAYVEASDGSQAAQFAITLKKNANDPNWVIDELNLDQLLSDYAKRFAGGDVYYSPLIKNPAGGDTLVLYFDFDEEKLTLRTERQLAIVAMILKTDTKKKIHLSGHTDALGSASYNQNLSGDRANSVKDYLIKTGVDPLQIVTAAKGLSEPRRPNMKADGKDDPEGRRANRRTEIYLDF
jgi:outer membrane protein OmpA-like peptidoglycan-associated protein